MQNFSWVCNCCGSKEFGPGLTEDQVHALACSGCGESEFHKEFPEKEIIQCSWTSVEEALPEIPKGLYAVQVLVTTLDSIHEETCPGCGQYVQTATYGSTTDRKGNKLEYFKHSNKDFDFMELNHFHGIDDDTWMPVSEKVTHWMYLPNPPRIEK